MRIYRENSEESVEFFVVEHCQVDEIETPFTNESLEPKVTKEPKWFNEIFKEDGDK